ncbi:hypothetical protein V6N12_009316 [Hibiscus sabdariffa]|uniref:Uncharacterized protein n=1 Tax=Hibiscus sabdariffa TaxID=183260 RepID=A0ABR2E8S0_9ROSI
MLQLYLCICFDDLLQQDDKWDVSAETMGPARAEFSADIQTSAERLAVYWLIPKSNNLLSCLYSISRGGKLSPFITDVTRISFLQDNLFAASS